MYFNSLFVLDSMLPLPDQALYIKHLNKKVNLQAKLYGSNVVRTTDSRLQNEPIQNGILKILGGCVRLFFPIHSILFQNSFA